MTEKTVIVSIPGGLTAKTATALIEQANTFSCSIVVSHEDRRVNCKSLLGILSLGLKEGDNIMLSADGADEEAALETLAANM